MVKIKTVKSEIATTDKVEGFRQWLTDNHGAYTALRETVIQIITNLLNANNIDFLAVTGRTKDIDSAVEKVTRKDYDDPQSQMTDITGVRVVLFFESDVTRVSKLIRDSFEVDEENSSNTDERMSTDQVGYRSVHFVCDLGAVRTGLPEMQMLAGMKFEFQVRTVLQHAWAVLAHDNSYKFSGSLPRPLERHLFLLAALMETADQGFDDLSAKIDEYKKTVSLDSAKGELEIPIDSLSLHSFLKQWAVDHKYEFRGREDPEKVPSVVVNELTLFGIKTLAEFNTIIPDGFAEKTRDVETMTMMGMVRICMSMHDHVKLAENVPHKWVLTRGAIRVLERFVSADRVEEIVASIKATSEKTSGKADN